MMKRKLRNRIFALLLMLCLVGSYIPTIAYATEAEENEVITNEETYEAENIEAEEEQIEEEKEEKPRKAKAPILTLANSIEDNGDYEEGQTEDVTLPEEAQEVTFVLEGASSVNAWIKGVSDAGIILDPDDEGSYTVEAYDILIHDGDKMNLFAGTDIAIQGVAGKYIYTGFSIEEDDAKANATSSELSCDATLGTTGGGYAYIKVTTEELESDCNIDSDGNITYPDIPSQGSNTQAGFDKLDIQSYHAGDSFYGSATLLEFHDTPTTRAKGKMRADNGWLKDVTARTIWGTCIDGYSASMGTPGSKFQYKVVIKNVDVQNASLQAEITYYPKNNKANRSYAGNWKVKKPTQRLQVVAELNLRQRYGYVTVLKKPQNTHVDYLTEFPNNYTLEGAEYRLYNKDGTPAKDKNGNDVIFTTDANGKTTKYRVPIDDYFLKETKPSKGFKIDNRFSYSSYDTEFKRNAVNLTLLHEDIDEPLVVESFEEPVFNKPEFAIRKIDPSGKLGYKKLINAEYTIKYYDVAVPYGDEDAVQNPYEVDLSGVEPARTWTFKTVEKESQTSASEIMAVLEWETDLPIAGDSLLIEPTNNRVMPLGYYTIEESKAPTGLGINPDVYKGKIYQTARGSEAENFLEGGEIASDGETNVYYTISSKDEPQAVKLEIEKIDSVTGTNEASGNSGTLAGAKYKVYYDGNEYASPVYVGTMTTDENGKASIEKWDIGTMRPEDKLPTGEYIIYEEKESDGYVLDKFTLDGTKTVDRDSKSITIPCFYDDNEEPSKNITGKFEDGTYYIRTRSEAENVNLFTYTVTSIEEPHQTEIDKVDDKGRSLSGVTLQILNSDGEAIEEWVTDGQSHTVYALPNGEYTLHEEESIYGYDLAEDIPFEVKENVIYNTLKMVNKPIKIGTLAKDKDTKSSYGLKAEEEVITDEVSLSGLYQNREYRLVGRVFNKTTGEFIKNTDGSDYTVEKTFTASSDTDTKTLEFTIDSSNFTEDTEIVIFEKLYRGDTELASHEDESDSNQTIHYQDPKVSTVAKDKKTNSHIGTKAEKEEIQDLVKVEKVAKGVKYRIVGRVFNKTTGEFIKNTDGSDYTVEKEFTAIKETDAVFVNFVVNSKDFEENTEIVIFEKLYRGNIELASHEDVNDKSQTIRYEEPPIGTIEIKDKPDFDEYDRILQRELEASGEGVVTGDNVTMLFLYTAISILSFILLLLMYVSRERKARLASIKTR